MERAKNKSWEKIFRDHAIDKHDFSKAPYYIDGRQIKQSCQNFESTGAKEVRILCKQDSREARPKIFQDKGLFLIPVKNGKYAILKGEGYVDIPEIQTKTKMYQSKLEFRLDTSKIGDSEMQHLDYAFATNLIRSVMDDDSLVLTIRGRKYTPQFDFRVRGYKMPIKVESVQTEVDAGYEGKKKVLLIEAKNASTSNVIIRQMYYPYRQWQQYTKKPVELAFFEKRDEDYCIWRFDFEDSMHYNSIRLLESARYTIIE